MPRVVHFEFNAERPERSARFYGDVFGWRIDKWQGPADYWLASTGEGMGIDGAIQGAPEFVAGQKTVVTIGVESVDGTAAKVEASGGAIVVPKMAIPHVGWLIYARDPDGMLFGVLEPDESANDGEAGESASDGEADESASDGEAGGSASDGEPGATASDGEAGGL